MRDKIFETSESLTVTDSSSLSQAREDGSSVSIGWGTIFILLIFFVGLAAFGTQVIKKKSEKGGGDLGGLKR